MLIDEYGIIYVGTYGSGFYVSFDNGSSWANPNVNCSLFAEDITLDINSDVLVVDKGCIHRSTDNGITWEIYKNTWGCRTVFINSLSYIFSGEEEDWNVGILWRSTDNGISWNSYALPDWAVVYSMDSDSSDNLYAGTTHGTFISTDNGDSWGNNQLADKWIPKLIITGNNTALAGTWGEGIFRSTDLGTIWNQTSLVTLQIRDFIPDKYGYIWTATDSGVFKSKDDGVTWAPIDNSGLTNFNIRAISIDPEGYIVIGADSGKVFKSAASTTGLSLDPIVSSFHLFQNYPNPFNPSTKIKFTIPKSSFVNLKVYDVLGREVAILINEVKPVGVYEVEFNASNLSSGLYFYDLNAGGQKLSRKMCLIK
jgi:photosystem II stability/assembly factor-like uncharacterized protein